MRLTLIVFVLVAASSMAQTFRALGSFNGDNGSAPGLMSLVQGTDGALYGTTEMGGLPGCSTADGCGTIFKVTREGELQSLYEFCSRPNCSDGDGLLAGLVLGRDGYLYGTTVGGGEPGCPGGCGTVFRITQGGALTTLHSFCLPVACADESEPLVPLIQAYDGKFYGAAASYRGSIFQMTPSGRLRTLYRFCSQPKCADGWDSSGLVQGVDGNFYGTTQGGGSGGTIFKLSQAGDLKTLYYFCSQRGCADGASPDSQLVQANDGNFYGTTSKGGAHGCCNGTVFRVTPGGQLTTLYSFCALPSCADGSEPGSALIQATDGNLYGMTNLGGDPTCIAPYGCGTIFKITLDGVLTTLHKFNLSDGAEPSGGLLQATDGNFYGATYAGGGPTSDGSVFQLSMGLPPFVAFVTPAGKVGQSGGILGQGFNGASSVLLNGVPATFKVISDTFLEATVPAGASTGYVTVTTPAGVLTSNVPFHVLP